MVNQYVLIVITAGVFVAGLGIGYVIFSTTFSQQYGMMQNPTMFNQMIVNNPQFMNTWMDEMISNPQAMNTWMKTMLENPAFMNQWMSAMMQNQQFQQQYMGPWMMIQNQGFPRGMMNQLAIPLTNNSTYAHAIVKTNEVSVVNGAWQYNTTESYSPTIIQITTGTTVTWTNDDSIVHTITDVKGTFDSHLIQPSTSWRYTFYNEGTYNYFCTLHPWMKGIVIVS